jgi:hypothetical protein
MESNEVDSKLLSLHHETKSFLLSQIEEFGPNPLGQSLIRAQKIYQLVYWDGDGQAERSKQIVFVGQKKTAGKDETTGELVKIEVVSIHYDWITSKQHGVPTHVIMGKRIDGVGNVHMNRYICSRNFEVVFNPPTERSDDSTTNF